jgi:hypothetical protein
MSGDADCHCSALQHQLHRAQHVRLPASANDTIFREPGDNGALCQTFAPQFAARSTTPPGTGRRPTEPGRVERDRYGLTLNTPPMTAAKKITAATKSNPVTIFLFRVTPENRRRGSNLEDRIHPTISAPAHKAISSV